MSPINKRPIGTQLLEESLKQTGQVFTHSLKDKPPAKFDAKQKVHARRIIGLTVPFKEGHSLCNFAKIFLIIFTRMASISSLFF
jgi:hypothetical protein